ncbi:MAG: hypothetical protein M3032_03820 [Verrucomicrobiota bacterium]|nr:hypothetical protein [Verrucomicrobiota bacterium]
MANTVPALKEDRVVFTSETKPFAVRDIIDAAHFRGEVQRPWEELRARLAAEKHAEEAGAELDDPAVDAAAIEFRYKYDLITAEETEQWLEMRGMTLSDFSEYFARVYWGKTFRGRADAETPALHEASSEMRELLAVDLILGGEFDGMAERLAWRVAASKNEQTLAEQLEVQRERFTARSGLDGNDNGPWLTGLGRDQAWLEEMLAMEAAFQARREKLLTREAADREIGALRLPLTRFDVETIEFESDDAASEAIWCVREDGMSMEEVAEEGRYPYRRAELLLEEIPDELQQKFLSVTAGTVLDPIEREDGFQVSRLVGKAEPNAADPVVQARIEDRILARHFAELTSKIIRWEITPVSTE